MAVRPRCPQNRAPEAMKLDVPAEPNVLTVLAGTGPDHAAQEEGEGAGGW